MAATYVDKESPQIKVPETDLAAYRQNPYVSTAYATKVVLRDNFFTAAAPLLDAGLDVVLKAFELNPEHFTDKEKAMITYRLRQQETVENLEVRETPTEQEMRIMANRVTVMNSLVEEDLKDIGQRIKGMSTKERKEVCLLIRDLPKDPLKVFTITRMIALAGISRNSYYQYINNEHYGMTVEERDAIDEEYVRRAFEYKGYKKGVRQVYMLIPRLTGKQIGLERVRRIMATCGMHSDIRKPNPHRRAAKEYMKNRKPNLLMRMFRLHRPNEVRVTDVTYLNYGDGQVAYGSALIDPVTSVLVAFVVSENDNLELAEETLRQNDNHPCEYGGIYHSDQGSLYLSPKFQKEVEDLGFKQSMSKRGNCWDNAVVESFFGHFKQEFDVAACKTIDELKKGIAEYAYYHNNERSLWDRLKMTPLEYEAYLLSLTDEEFSEYMERETEKYEKMKANSAEKAKERNKTLGV